MRVALKIAGVAAIFAAGYVVAKSWSRPSEPMGLAGDTLGKTAGAPSALASRAVGVVDELGVGALIGAMAEVEAALARGDFESLLGGEWEEAALRAWVEADPAGLWECLQARAWVVPSDTLGLDRTLFINWFRRDPDAAVAALEVTNSYARRNGRWAMVGLLFDDDPDVVRAVGERLDLFAANIRPQPGEHGSRHWRGGLEVVERMMGLPDSKTKAGLIEVAVGGWAEKDWRGARDWAASLPPPQRAAMERAIFTGADAWRQIREPEGIAWTKEWLAREENRDMRAKLGGDVIEAIARKDPEAALEWAGENLGGRLLGEAVGTIVTRQFGEDRETAIALVDGLPPGGVRQRAGSDLIKAMAPKEPQAALGRALQDLEDGYDIGRGAWARIGENLAEQDPAGVWEILAVLPDEVPWIFQERIYLKLPDDQMERTLEQAAGIDGGYGDWIYQSSWRRLNEFDPAAAARWDEKKPKR